MKTTLIDLLRCPLTGQPLEITGGVYLDDEIESGWLVSKDGSYRYPIRDFIPRFVPESNYADNFGMQWNRFRMTQLDSYSGHPISADRFWKESGWRPEDLAGKWVLDVGCGAGRFAEVALAAGANVIALDYSGSVDACFVNLRHHPNLHLAQGDIYALPFRKGTFSFVYAFGVLQFTPDVERAFFSLPPMLAKGGRICLDVYQKSWKSGLHPKYWLRPMTKHISIERLFSVVQMLVPKLLPLSVQIAKFPFFGNWLKRLVPVANYVGVLPLSEEQHLEWSILDTFNWFSPKFDKPQTLQVVRRWMDEANLDGEVLNNGYLVVRAAMPQ